MLRHHSPSRATVVALTAIVIIAACAPDRATAPRPAPAGIRADMPGMGGFPMDPGAGLIGTPVDSDPIWQMANDWTLDPLPALDGSQTCTVIPMPGMPPGTGGMQEPDPELVASVRALIGGASRAAMRVSNSSMGLTTAQNNLNGVLPLQLTTVRERVRLEFELGTITAATRDAANAKLDGVQPKIDEMKAKFTDALTSFSAASTLLNKATTDFSDALTLVQQCKIGEAMDKVADGFASYVAAQPKIDAGNSSGRAALTAARSARDIMNSVWQSLP